MGFVDSLVFSAEEGEVVILLLLLLFSDSSAIVSGVEIAVVVLSSDSAFLPDCFSSSSLLNNPNTDSNFSFATEEKK